MGAREELIEAFAEDLRQLRQDVGQPSFRDLESCADKVGRPLPRTTASDLVRGRRLPPKSNVVIAFVMACRHYAEKNGIPVPDRAREVHSWQDAWAKAWAGLKELERLGEPTPHTLSVPTLHGGGHSPRRNQWWIPERRRCSYLLIGSSTPGAPFHMLPGVRRDCERMAVAVVSAAPWMSLTVMLDPTNQEAHRAIREALAAPLELLVVHVVGHGYLNESARLSLIMEDSQEDNLLQTSLDLEGLLTQAGQHSQERAVILIVDTAFAGAVLPSAPLMLKHWFVLAATEANGLAYDTSGMGGEGTFTAVLARLLANGITASPYPLVTVMDLAQEAREAVLRQASAVLQTVTWGGTTSTETLSLAFNHAK